VRVLLDAHVFLWWSAADDRLSDRARDVIQDGRNECMVSVASMWEIAIKDAKGDLELPEDVEYFIEDRLARNRWTELPIARRHALRAASLPPIHRDPFDRILVAQSQIESIPLITTDVAITRYDVETIW
jgi:PIN domain nuclease of toxin-antitoxin system